MHPGRVARVVPPRAWWPDQLRPWEEQNKRGLGSKSSKPPAPLVAPPKKLVLQGLFKSLVNIYNLEKLQSGDSFISHAREASILKHHLSSYLNSQIQSGAKPHFPVVVESRLQLYFCNSGEGGLHGDSSKMGTADQSV